MLPLTCSCFLLLLLGRLFLLALPFFLGIGLLLRWSPPFPIHALAPIPLSPTLTLSSLMIWCFRQTALFLFLLAKAALAFLPTALSVALRPLFPFQQAQYDEVSLLKPARSLLVLAAPTSLPFLFSYYLTLVLSSPPSFLLSQSQWQIWQELSSLSSCSIRLQWVPDTHFYWRTMQLMSWPNGVHYLRPPAIPCSLSPFISHIHSRLISDWRHTVSSKFFDTQVPSISTKELVLPCHARCVLSRFCCNGHSLLLSSYLSRIGRIENPSCSACGHLSQDTSHLILHCPTTDSLATLYLRPLVQTLGSCPASGAPWSSAMPPSLRRGQVNNKLLLILYSQTIHF